VCGEARFILRADAADFLLADACWRSRRMRVFGTYQSASSIESVPISQRWIWMLCPRGGYQIGFRMVL
jgi:hypothetical protein